MLLTKAIELVVADTRESTDPDLTILEVIEIVREHASVEFDFWLYEGIIDETLHDAYVMVGEATEEEIQAEL